MNLSKIHQKNTRASYMSSQNWIQIRSISVKRTSGSQRYYQRIQKEIDAFEQGLPQTGESIMDLVKSSNYLWKNGDPRGIDETLYDSAEPKEKCHILKQKLNSIMTYFFPTNGTTSS